MQRHGKFHPVLVDSHQAANRQENNGCRSIPILLKPSLALSYDWDVCRLKSKLNALWGCDCTN